MSELNESMCVICCSTLNDQADHIQLKSSGLQTLTTFSGLHGDTDLRDYLLSHPNIVNVHVSCRLKCTSKRRLEQHN